MFVRFRASARRLDLALVEPKREGAKVRQEHVASLGSCPVEPSTADRVAFWRRLHERLARLSNRITPEDSAKILGAVHAKVPMVTPDEQRALQLENAEKDARLLAGARDILDIEGHRKMAAAVEKKIAKGVETAERAEAAAGRVAKIKRGEDVQGGLGKPMTHEDVVAALLELGLTRKDLRRAEWYASLGDKFEPAMEAVLKNPKFWEARDDLFARLMRRAIRDRARG